MMPQGKGLLILDFDGTIGDTRQVIVSTLHATLQAEGLPDATDEACAATIGIPLFDAFMTLNAISREQAEACVDTYRRLFFKNHRPGVVPLFPNVKETIRQMHCAGVTITIASSRSHQSLQMYADAMELTPYLSLILGADDVSHAKPHPEPVLITMRRFGVSPSHTLVVGDTKYDILMGCSADARTCGVTYGNGTADELRDAGADAIVADFADVMKVFRNYCN